MIQATEYISSLEANNRWYFTTQQAISDLGQSVEVARTLIRQLKQTGEVATPYRSFHVIVPRTHRNLKCLPSSYFIGKLMEHLNEPYYIGLLSAAARYGASHQKPQIFQVMVKKKRPEIHCGRVRIRFISRSNFDEMPTRDFDTYHGKLRYSTPEVTALELMGFPSKAAGISNATTVLIELAESLSSENLESTASLMPVSWAQRLGYLLELVGETQLAESLISHVKEHAHSYTPLLHRVKASEGEYVPKWKLIVNTEVDPDL